MSTRVTLALTGWLALSGMPLALRAAEPGKDGREAKLNEVLAAYQKACAQGDFLNARELGQKALSMDPECFYAKRQNPQETAEPIEAFLVNNEHWGPIMATKETWKETLWRWFMGPPSHMTFDRIHGGIE